MGLINKLFWIALTVVFTFCFVVLFENGTDNYVDNAQKQFTEVKAYFEAAPKKKADTSDKLK
jgi:hypothetical protein